MKKNILLRRVFSTLLIWCILIAIMPSLLIQAFAQNMDRISETTLTKKSFNINLDRKLETKNQIGTKKGSLSKEKRKISTDLLKLVDNNFIPQGKSQLELKNEMKLNKQYMRSTDIVSKSSEIFEGVYVYVTLNKGVDIYAVDSFLQNVTDRDEKSSVVVAWVDLNKLLSLAADNNVKSIKTVIPPKANVGSKTTEGAFVQKADKVLKNFKQDGAGMKIGVISDGVDDLSSSVLSGDLPNDVVVLGESTDTGNQSEGVAMLEIIYDMAPGAKLYFHDMGINTIAFNSAIDDLVAAGCNVIVDDVGWLGEPFFEDGDVASHIADVLNSKNIIYVSSAGNGADQHYQGEYSAYSPINSLHSVPLFVNIPPGGNVLIIAQWNDKFGSSYNDYDLYLHDVEGETWDPLDWSTYTQDGNDDPFEAIYYTNTTASTIDAVILIDNYEMLAQTKTLEIFIYPSYGSNLDPTNLTSADSIFGHPAVPGVLAVGAVDQTTSSTIRYYSSLGPVSISYPSVVSRKKPDICGVDGVSVTGAGGFVTRFYGTSAAAPHIAAIAALLWAENPQKTGSQISDLLRNNATDIGSPGYDNTYGYGLSDAMKVFMATMADNTFAENITKSGGKDVTIASSGISTNEVWFAPSDTSSFVQGPTMTKALGDATSISAPALAGTYKLYLIVDGDVSSPSIATLTVDNTPPQVVVFKGSSLGELSNEIFARTGGQHNLVATYQNITNETLNTAFIVAVKKNNKIVSIYTTNKIFKPLETIDFTKTIEIPSNIYDSNVEVDFYLWDDIGTIKPVQNTIKNAINYAIPPPTMFSFKGSSLGEPTNVTFARTGGQHNLLATYQNNTNESINTTFIVAVKKAQRVVSLYLIDKTFQPLEIVDFSKTINIPSTLDSEVVEVDFFLWDSVSTMKTKHDTVKNSINNVR